MQKRRRFKQLQPLDERLAEEAKRLRAKARSIRPGAQRAELLRKAAQIEAGLHMAKTLPPRPSKATVTTPRCGDVRV